MTKKEKIKEDYLKIGLNLDLIPENDHVYEDGLISLTDLVIMTQDSGLNAVETSDNSMVKSQYGFIPISLIGVEDNNGWVKIESEDQIPEFGFGQGIEIGGFDGGVFYSSFKNSHHKLIRDLFKEGGFTHIKMVEKSKPAVY